MCSENVCGFFFFIKLLRRHNKDIKGTDLLQYKIISPLPKRRNTLDITTWEEFGSPSQIEFKK